MAILLLKGIRCSANSLWQKYNTKDKNHFDHLFEHVQSCRAVHFQGRWAQFGLGEDLQEVVRSRKEGRLFESNKTLTQSHMTEIKELNAGQTNSQTLSPP